ncbi:Na/Pi cotransporter family protein [Bacilliculturomica massiliensis]|uniref:Na/Pi cotransporter family protein n=1 Tax=Bacilliculturomica massiliensis TaxID=1917867 RepID=UPI0013EF4F5F|nr:Na/Pi cotransporter family protein [Bacilliculturomica massiliensis]
MSFANLLIAFQILGGSGLLLYGIEVMKDSLELVTEGKTLRLLEMSRKSTLKSIFAGMIVTMINQKSTATTVMVVGLVNAGMMSLVQAAGVIMGANIGTTVTAQLLAFRVELLAPCIVGVAVFFWKYTKSKKIEELAGIFVGAGIMFVGMIFIESALLPLLQYPSVQQFIRWSENLSQGGFILIILVGFLLTAVLRSSSVITGIMIAMSARGLLNLDAGLALILGINIGKCLTAVLAARGATRTGKRAAVIHLLFNTFGAVLVVLFFRGWFEELLFFLSPVNVGRQIANAHTLFNLGTAVICLPLVGRLVGLSGKIVPARKQEVKADTSSLDVRMLETPGLALAQTNNEIAVMAELSLELFDCSCKAVLTGAEKYVTRVEEEESNVIRMQKEIEVYLVKLSRRNISEAQHRSLNLMLGVTGDVERISDAAFTISKLATFKKKNGIHLSEDAKKELTDLQELIMNVAEGLIPTIRNGDAQKANRLLSAEIKLGNMEETLRESHVERLNQGVCNPGSGVLFLDMVGHMERVVDYMRRICFYVIDNDKY